MQKGSIILDIKVLQKSPHPSGRIICFNESNHTYYAEDNPNEKFISVTTFINKFFPKFKFDEISFVYAMKNGLDVNEVRQAWIDKREKATELGKKVHLYVKKFLTSSENYAIVFDNEIEKHYFKQVRKAIKTMYYFGMEFECSECILADLNWKIAGTTDLVFRFEDSLHLLDWKTSQKIKTHNQFQKGLTPIKHLDDVNYNKYILQLNLYELLIRNNGYYPWAKQIVKRIIHLSEDKFEFIDVPDMQREIKSMLKFR